LNLKFKPAELPVNLKPGRPGRPGSFSGAKRSSGDCARRRRRRRRRRVY